MKLKLKVPEIGKDAVGKYIKITLREAAISTTPIIGFIFIVFALFSFFPKHFDHKNENYVHSVFDDTGIPLYIEHSDKNGCIPLAYSDIPEFFLKCLYNQEDRGFTNQNNWLPQRSNWHGISLAMFYRIFNGSGGSNINMQLIKNIAFQKQFPQDVQRKFSETLASYQLSIQTPDTAILIDYLNEVSMNGGKGHSGVEAASLYTFGQTIRNLNPLELMYMVTTLKRGSRFKTNEGYINYEEAESHIKEIKSVLLEQARSWQENGLLSDREFIALKNQDLRFVNRPYRTKSHTTTNEFLIRQMKRREEKGTSYLSSISFSNQQAITKAVRKFNIDFQEWNHVQGSTLYTAAIVVNVRDGKVIGHYGGEGVSDLTQFGGGSPVGSIIKPIILLELLEEGFNFENIKLYDGSVKGKLTPNNFNGLYSNRLVGITEILGKSLNAPMVNIRLITDALSVYKNVEERFSEMGITKDQYINLDDISRMSENEINYPLGNRNMTLFDIAQAYQVIFNKGKFIELSALDSFYSPNEYIKMPISQKQSQIYSQENASLIMRALNNGMNNGGTGAHLNRFLPGNKKYFIKTGTSDNAIHGYTVLFDEEILIVTYASYGKIKNGRLELNDTPPIPYNSGSHSAGVLAAYIYNELL